MQLVVNVRIEKAYLFRIWLWPISWGCWPPEELAIFGLSPLLPELGSLLREPEDGTGLIVLRLVGLFACGPCALTSSC